MDAWDAKRKEITKNKKNKVKAFGLSASIPSGVNWE